MTNKEDIPMVEHDVLGYIDEVDNSIVYRHERHKVGICAHCDYIRTRNLTNEFIRRLDTVQGEIRALYMWSLGTSLTDTPTNHKILMTRWAKFTKRMNHCEDWLPLFRVVEVGRRGFLHFHVIAGRFVDHGVVLKAWRDLTREKSNVHVSGYKGNLNPARLARYLMKYLSKSTSTYRFMGPLYGHGRKTSRRAHDRALKYGGVTCYKAKFPGYQKREDQQKIDK